ncbi:MAG: hypothetical protein RIS47_565, partial [Bacteroidota bacterium]
MKKILYTLVSGLLLFTACNKQEDPIFDKTPEERIEAVETE